MSVRTLILVGALAALPTLAHAEAGKNALKGKVKLPKGTAAGAAYVYLKGDSLTRTVPKEPLQLRQKNKQFGPRVLVLVRGTVVDFPNDDRIMHNVYSRSTGNAFDLGHYKKGESKQVTFNKSGAVDVYCNIHPNMSASLLVVDNDYVTPLAADGSFTLANVPAGKYELVAWMPASTPASVPIEIKDGAASPPFKLELAPPNTTKEHTNKDGMPHGRYK